MRWLLVSAQHHPTHGGIGTYVQRFVACATKAGWQVDLLTRPSDRLPEGATPHLIETLDAQPEFASRIEGLRAIERIRPYRYGLWAKAVAEALLTLRGRFDAIEFVDSQAEGYAALTSDRVGERLRGTPMVMHAHTPMWIDERIAGADPGRFGRSIYHRWERDAIAAADGVLCTSSRLVAELPARRPPTVLPYPIEIAERPPQPIERRGEILLVGAVQPRKGVEVWARSLNEVLARNPSARAVLIGPDTPTAPNGGSMVAFVREIVAPALRDRFDWLGALAHQAVMERIARASLLVVPSLFESFSFAAAEALDRGTPTVVSDCVGIAEHVDGLVTVPTGDSAALAAAQCDVLADPARARSAALAARESLRVRCSGAEHLRRRQIFLGELPRSREPQTGVDTLDALDAFLADVEAREPRSSVVS